MQHWQIQNLHKFRGGESRPILRINKLSFKTKIAYFSGICDSEFKLKSKPIIKVLKSVRMENCECYGIYTGVKFSYNTYEHEIKISKILNKTDICLFNTIAHEYVHCWQLENRLPLAHDKNSGFKMWRKYFKQFYKIDLTS